MNSNTSFVDFHHRLTACLSYQQSPVCIILRTGLMSKTGGQKGLMGDNFVFL
ncbi:hypothetical protein [Clostridium thermosuccinogenes]|uniref:hypothetical protein n=1 Tax=Clostridium thermosuccinogenes TaxID=84032 RepID=UPI001A9A3FCC|nr:hypothetical protein [Pseudoclostridium thermosuccinogenes]